MPQFKVATFNANSIRMRLPQIITWLGEVAPDVLCIQETKVQDKDFPAADIEAAGYQVLFRGQKSYAGVAILSKSEPENVQAGLLDGSDEPRLLRCTVNGVHIVNTYVPQGREVESEHFQYKLSWLAQMRELFATEYSTDDLLLWCGDLNVAPEDIDVYNPKALANHVDFHPDAKAALERIREWGFVDVFRKHHPGEEKQFTYWDYRARNPIENGVGWRIDHIWTTAKLADKSTACWVDVEARKSEKPSDHTFMVAEFDL